MLLPEVELHRNELPVPRPGSAWQNIAMPSLNGHATGGNCPGVYHEDRRNFVGPVYFRLDTVQLGV